MSDDRKVESFKQTTWEYDEKGRMIKEIIIYGEQPETVVFVKKETE